MKGWKWIIKTHLTHRVFRRKRNKVTELLKFIFKWGNWIWMPYLAVVCCCSICFMSKDLFVLSEYIELKGGTAYKIYVHNIFTTRQMWWTWSFNEMVMKDRERFQHSKIKLLKTLIVSLNPSTYLSGVVCIESMEWQRVWTLNIIRTYPGIIEKHSQQRTPIIYCNSGYPSGSERLFGYDFDALSFTMDFMTTIFSGLK